MNWRVSSCCCFSLKTGTLILGYLGAIGTGISSLAIIFAVLYTRGWIEESNKGKNNLTPEQLDAAVLYTQIALGVALVATLFGCIFNVLLLVGVYKEKSKLIKIYVIVSTVGCVLSALATVGYLLGSFADSRVFGKFLSQLLSLALQIYFTMVVHSYHLEVIESRATKRDGSNLPRQF